MDALCCVCFYRTEVDEEDTSTVCENCQMELMVYEDGTTEVVTDEVLE